jgi:tRNA(His) 5'-end guanylyltransferase
MEKTLGDRMKRYEMEEAGRRLMPRLPIMARLDGRAFHTLTRGMDRPFDRQFSLSMIETMKHLVDAFSVSLAYTQSDEITLMWTNDDPFSEMPFDGRQQKLVSLLAAEASVAFNHAILNNMRSGIKGRRPTLDCRVWQVPNLQEAYHCFLWREDDATRNSLQMAAQSVYSAKELHKKGRAELHDMLYAKGINWNDYPAFFKRGTYAKRISVHTCLTEEELAKIPAKYREEKRMTMVTRTPIICLEMPPLLSYGSLDQILGGPVFGRDPLE